jgi:hypothetical protein
VFTARYALSPYIKQIRFVFKGLIGEITSSHTVVSEDTGLLGCDVLSLRAVRNVSQELSFFLDVWVLEGSTFLGNAGNRSTGDTEELNPQTSIPCTRSFIYEDFQKKNKTKWLPQPPAFFYPYAAHHRHISSQYDVTRLKRSVNPLKD